MTTLAIDIGGMSLKLLVLDEQGEPISETLARPTPVPSSPEALFTLIHDMAGTLPPHRRVSVGFPGVVKDGVTWNAPNLGDELWNRVPLSEKLGYRLELPVRAVNDVDLQGLGVVQGDGVELVLTLGTGMGAALFTDGALVPNLELGHHPFRDGKTYEDLVRDSELKRIGRVEWTARVLDAIAANRADLQLRSASPRGGQCPKHSIRASQERPHLLPGRRASRCVEALGRRLSAADERVQAALFADRRVGAVAADHQGFVWQGEELAFDRVDELRRVAAPQVAATDTPGEEGVARDDEGSIALQSEANTARRVPRRVNDVCLEPARQDGVAIRKKAVDGRHFWCAERGPEPIKLHLHAFIEEQIFFVNHDRRIGPVLDLFGRADVIEVCVRVDDPFAFEAELFEARKNPRCFAPRIDDDPRPPFFVAKNHAVAPERRDGEMLDDHGGGYSISGVAGTGGGSGV